MGPIGEVLSALLRAQEFYERHGGALAGESIITLGGVRYPQVAYAWPDLEILCKSAPGTSSVQIPR